MKINYNLLLGVIAKTIILKREKPFLQEKGHPYGTHSLMKVDTFTITIPVTLLLMDMAITWKTYGL